MKKPLKVWLVKEGESLPTDEGQQRLLRMGLIASEFEKTGADILWFASTFNHNLKEFRADHTMEVRVNQHYTIRLLHGRNYTKNLSLGRIMHFWEERRQFSRLVKGVEMPDVILAAMPNIDLALASVKYGKQHGVPVFVDVRDLWPDLYEDFFPRLKWLVHLAIIPFKIQLAYTLRNATGILATSEGFLDWALRYACRGRGPNDNYYYVSYPDTDVDLGESDYQYWYDMGLSSDDIICCFFGQFGHAVELEPVMHAAIQTAKQNPRIKYVICGEGEKLNSYKQILGDVDNVLFPGWVSRRQICALGDLATVGLLSYRKNKNFEWSMPNKFCEYLALGLAVVVEPEGMMADLIKENDIGFRYDNSAELASELLYLAEHGKEAEGMKRRARALYERQFKADVVYGKMVADIIRMTAERGGQNAH